jgi:uncharacterized protein (TIGR02757 family)
MSGETRLDILADRLNRLHETYDISFLDPDPLVLVREFSDPRDLEIAALFASAIAFGGVRTIMADVERLFDLMNGAPWETITQFDPVGDAGRFDGWYHRFVKGHDIALLASCIRRAIEEHGSLGQLFTASFDLSDPDIGPALAGFVAKLRSLAIGPDSDRNPPGRYFNYLLSSPADGSACKRMNLFLRWVVRTESPDLGLWRHIPVSHLVMPLDTHVARICRNIGLTTRKTANWAMAKEITAALRRIDPTDPVKYDYAICRLGILGHCPTKHDPAKCAGCPIQDICVL